MRSLYTDGGIIFRGVENGKTLPYGGSWAWCLVESNQIISEASGIIEAEDIDTDTVTNNHAELYALCVGLLTLPDDFVGVVYCDSLVSLGRVFLNHALRNVPDPLIYLVEQTKKRVQDYVGAAGRSSDKGTTTGGYRQER